MAVSNFLLKIYKKISYGCAGVIVEQFENNNADSLIVNNDITFEIK